MTTSYDLPDTIPGTDRPLSHGFVRGYALGYFHGRANGDSDAARDELIEQHGESTVDNLDEWAGFNGGYDDGVHDFMELDEGV